jgi:hypothetical protein
MRSYKQVAAIWLSAVAVEVVLLNIFAHGVHATLLSTVLGMVWLLIGIVSAFIFLKERNSVAKPIFLNFSFFILYGLGQFVCFFVGPGATFFADAPFATVYVFQYLQALNYFLLSFGIIYVVVDSLFCNFHTYQKYMVALLIVGGVFANYYHPFFSNPKYLYATEDVSDYRAIGRSVSVLENLGKPRPTATEAAAMSNFGLWRNGAQVGILFDSQKASRAAELLPYLEGENYVPLVYRPIFLSNIYMSVLCVVFIFLFFGYQYKNDPPQGAYIEKIIFLFLPYCSLEILHHFAFIKSVEFSTFNGIIQIGQYLSLASLLVVTVFFGLRLRFVTSVKGEFYERELVSDSEHISRWRDAFDNLLVRHFLNPKAIHGRLFAPRTPRNKA